MSESRASNLFTWLRQFAAVWGFALFLLFVVLLFRAVILPFVLGILLAYILSPVVRRLSSGKRGMPRWAAIIVCYVGIAGAIIVFVVTFVPYLSGDFARLFREAPPFFRNVRQEWVPRADAWLETAFPDLPRAEGLPARPDRKLIVTPQVDGGYQISLEGLELEVEAAGRNRYVIGPRDDWDTKRTRLADMIAHAATATEAELKQLLLVGQRFISKLIRGFAFFVLMFMVAAYLLVDIDRVMSFLRSLVPAQHHVAYDDLLREFDRGLAGVIRGQLLICLLNAALTTAGLLLFRVKYAVLLGMVAGVLSFIPVFGSIVSSVPIVTVALASGQSGVSLSTGLAVLAWIIGIHLLEANFFNPKIIGTAAKIHPVVVVFALMVGEHFGGLIGALLAVPIASMVQAMFLFFRGRADRSVAT
jgi:predicted PurR-regulated permease PerM